MNKLNIQKLPPTGIYEKNDLHHLKRHFSQLFWDNLLRIQCFNIMDREETLGCCFLQFLIEENSELLDLENLSNIKDKLIESIQFKQEPRKDNEVKSLEDTLSYFFEKGSIVIYRIHLNIDSGWISGKSYRNPLLLSDMYFQWLSMIAGERARVIPFPRNIFLMIFPENFKIDRDLLEHQLNLKLKDYKENENDTISENLFQIDSEVFYQMNESLLQFIEEGQDGPEQG